MPSSSSPSWSRSRWLIRSAILLLVAGSITWWLFSAHSAPLGIGRVGPYDPLDTTWQNRAGAVRLVDTREPVMGTRFSLEIAAPDRRIARAADIAAWRRIAQLEARMSTFVSSSILSKVNREAARHPVRVDRDTFAVLLASRRFWRLSGRAFDPTVGPLIALWKPLHRLATRPTDAQIAAATALVGFDQVSLDPSKRSVRFAKPGMSLDVGGIAKGYTGDQAAAAALATGALACRVNAGGDLTCRGAPPWDSRGFEVEVRNPSGGEDAALPHSTFHLLDEAVATSGNYERFTRVGKRRFSHIVDPRTGWPVPNAVAQVTVITGSGTEADALATALTVLGPEKGKALAEKIPGLEALFLIHAGSGYRKVATPGFPEGDR